MKKYMSIDDVANDPKYPFSKGQVRHLVAKRKINGLATSIRKIGRRVYIREDLLDIWMDSHIEESSIQIEVKKMDIKIEDLDLSIRAQNCLNTLNIKTLNDIMEKTKEELLECKSMGKKTLNEIIDKVMSMGFNIKEW